ncbi:putative phage protein [Actinoplanes missouriensis 431]|uniref:Putative phage protein n=1 Tax=Actinoplanes missouriensis (strain ATCC 14538 / DSM 43046 / CBS 188.64 / JCM 3121 / NBRC 102363 / NCIMB 12654 / NRRL B-3342 / UNCC 431) TaxID=512565 RepID=I0GXK0_ACTM4|nr:hypothetical protein [Actinoplanes missouriensis]KOX45274.1 hypothetical protein ADL19_23455 [Streptomyces purpurogeneiscleroticus]BAL85487.1 putative phage protein [Actinoplanes missouriensis 431]
MARIRTIKPEFFTSLAIASLTLEARLTFIGLWTHVDDEGRCVDDARLIKAAVWPLDDRLSSDVELDLKALSESSLITRYTVGARSFLAITNWNEHQRINRPTRSKIPAPPPAETAPASPRYAPPPAETTPHSEPSHSPHAPLAEDSLAERNREQGTGNRENPAARVREDDPAGTPGRAEQIVQAWMTACTRRPPSRVVDAIGREVAQLLRDDIDPSDIQRALEYWQGRGMHPTSLPSVVNQVMNARPQGNVVALSGHTPRPSTTDQRVGAALELAAKYAQEDQ